MLATGALLAVMTVIVFGLIWFSHSENAFMLALLPFGIAYIVASYLLSAQRIRDMGATGWLALLWIPIQMADAYLHGAASLAAWIVLCSVPGTQGANRYGPDPLRRDMTHDGLAENSMH